MNEYLDTIKLQLTKNDKYDINEYYIQNKFPLSSWKFIMQNIISPLEINANENLNGIEICKTFEALGYTSQDGGLNFAIGAHTLAAAIPLVVYGSKNQKTKYLNKVLNGEVLCANAITESEAGSDIFSMNSSAIQNENNYILNGVKTFCSSIKEANIALVYVITDKEKGAHGGISTFIIDNSQFKVGQTYSKMGLRTCSIGELLMENIEISKDQILGQPGAGLGIFTTAMDWERVGLSACYVGTMQRLFEQTLTYAKTRKQKGKIIGKHQAISHKIAEMKTIITACRLMIYNTAPKLGKERSVSEEASMCKWFISESYIKICEMAMQIHGGNGYMEDYGIERCLRDAQASTIYSGTTEIQKNIIASWNGL
jgi:alkylation response protein AidB-like acyl-CoA dehydrogenase